MMGEATALAVVDGMIRFNPREVHPRAIAHLLRDLSFPNPEYISRVRYGRWVGTTPEEISLLEEHEGIATVPRGAVALVREAVRAAGQDRKSVVEGKSGQRRGGRSGQKQETGA